MLDVYSKIDLHIHSCYSRKKDGDKVKDNTIENAHILLENLNKNEVNIFSITDHNNFNYSLYKAFRDKIGSNYEHIKKILPGIEFDLSLQENVHVVCIFNDLNGSNDDKLLNIETVISKNSKDVFTVEEFEYILKEIDLDVLLIAHQKCDPDNADVYMKNNLSNSGLDTFNKLLRFSYIDAVEFQQERVSGMLKAYTYKQEGLQNLIGITGSDCHQWISYPQYSSNKKGQYSATYVKSLPTFKGLVMAFTDKRRIKSSKPIVREPFLKELILKVNGEKKIIPLSSGINAIIGDNTTGKSLILNKLFNNVKSEYLDNYTHFLNTNKLEITTQLDELSLSKIDYDYQGKIRNQFVNRGASLYNKFPEYFIDIDFSYINQKIGSIVDNLFVRLQENKKLKESENLLNESFTIPYKTSKSFNLTIKDSIGTYDKKYNKILTTLKSIKNNLKNLLDYDEFEEKKKILDIITEINTIETKYNKLYEEQNFKNRIVNIFKTIKNKVNEILNSPEKTTDTDVEISNFLSKYSEEIDHLVDYFKLTNKEKTDPLKDFETLTIKPTSNFLGEYKFITSPAYQEFNIELVKEIILSPFANFKLESYDKLLKFEIEDLVEPLSDVVGQKIKQIDVKQRYLSQLETKLKTKYFQKNRKILLGDDSIDDNNSAGKNALYYIDIQSKRDSIKLYVADQPEDDVSQNKTHNFLSNTLKKMSTNKQVIIVTHNPQLVVNLDVDNVICISNEKEFEIKNGSLEFEDEEVNILNEVATTLDGGAQVIQKRWKRYEKDNQFDD